MLKWNKINLNLLAIRLPVLKVFLNMQIEFSLRRNNSLRVSLSKAKRVKNKFYRTFSSYYHT